MLATRISFMNELALLAERLGADIERVRQGIGSDPRIGYQFLYPGCGYGGSCFPKDVQALQRTATENGLDLRILEAVETVNERQKAVLLDKIDAHFGESLKGKCFALWGLAFKPNTDDMREAPARVLIEGLLQRGATLRAFDPVAMEEARHIFGQRAGLTFVESAEMAVEGADALVVVTEWQVFRSPDFEHMVRFLRERVIFDGRNLYEPHLVRAAGLTYHGIGRL
jgi:Predicted UDP-glucose 6-dehydrogenase